MKNTPIWGKKVNIALIDKGMSKRKLAQELKVNYTQLCSVISGTVYNENMRKLICEFFGIK